MKTKRIYLRNKNKSIKNNPWSRLVKNNCRFLNNSKVKKNAVKIKKIALEEAIIWPTQTEDVVENVPLEYVINTGKGNNKYNRLLDITDLRLKEMDENNVVFQIISPTAAGIQGLKLKSKLDQVNKAKEINDYMYKQIENFPNRFRAFATLPMRDPKEAAHELDRCVKNLKMLGALVNGNDILHTGKNHENAEILFYDTPDYDVLWSKFVELDVPLYIHPTVYMSPNGSTPDPQYVDFYKKYPQLSASAWGFSIYLAEHMFRLVLSGVFDRFPKLKIILGHMGEILPWWAKRFDHRLCVYKQELNEISKEDFNKAGLKEFHIPKLTMEEYLKQNFYITTSGWYSDDDLKYTIKKVGIDRVLFSIDYPYEKQNIACEWMDNVPLSLKDKEKIAYKNAAKLLKIKM